MTEFKNIPTNIISGFLGAGKTTVIQYLLKHKPVSEVWAVVVNEFGQVGIDGALLKNPHVEIKQIPGGCLCCVGSQALNVGLNQIIRSVKPQRILIEPTGLGHPAKLISTLSGEFYKNVLDLKAVINLIDARNLNDTRYLENATFIEQSVLADILVATKRDTYSEDDKNCFFDYAMGFKPEKLEVTMIEQGQLNLSWLDISRIKNIPADNNAVDVSHSHSPHAIDNTKDNQLTGWNAIEGQADGYFSLGWKLDRSIIFERRKLLEFVDKLFTDSNVERVKAVVNTDAGWWLLNLTRNERDIQDTNVRLDVVLEIISSDYLNVRALGLALSACQI